MEGMMRNKNFRVGLGILAAVCLVMAPWGCSQAPDEPGQPAERPASAKPEQEAAEDAYTREHPGAWGGKEDSHVPQIEYQKTASGLKVTVSVSHEMNPEKPHYIMWIQLKDGQDNLLGEKQFQADAAKAEAVFTLANSPSRLIAYEKCNLHGLWKEEVEVN
jgi:superoxide reductase